MTLVSGYEVQDWVHLEREDPTDGEKTGEPYYIWLPNIEAGNDMVCAHDDECQVKENEEWGYMSEGPRLWSAVSNKGGPQEFVWGIDPANRWN